MVSSDDDEAPYFGLALQIRSRRRAKTASRTPPARYSTSVTAKKKTKLPPTLNLDLDYSSKEPLKTFTNSSSPYSTLSSSPLTLLSPTLPISMPKPIPNLDPDSGDDDTYSEDDVKIWHGSSKRTNSALMSKRTNSAGAFNTRPYNPPNYVYSTSSGSSNDIDDKHAKPSGYIPNNIVGSSSYAPKPPSDMSLRARIFSLAVSPLKGKAKAKERDRLICTKPGERGAGETETELDEPPKHLPTARLAPTSAPLIPPHFLQKRVTPLLFQCFRLLAVVPAFIGVLWCILCIIHYEDQPRTGRRRPDRTDYVVSILWALLTGYQCLALTTGLLTRWRVYYPPLATLIRLLGLQAICWPATQFTMTMFDVSIRPVTAWAIAGTSTCMSRSAQIWVTSNLWWDSGSGSDAPPSRKPSVVNLPEATKTDLDGERGPRWRGGRWGGRRWDWNEVVWKCMLPAGVLYCITAWVGEVRREWEGC